MFNLDHFIADCQVALTQGSPELAIREILERTVASPSELEAALGTPRQAQIATLHHDRDLTILNIVWTPGMSVYPHDHRMWALLGKTVIHAVQNPLRVFTGAIHIYGGDFFGTPRSDWDPETLEERPYDVERARKVIVDANERWLAEREGAGGS